jgi:prophage DNA circulation protein
MSASVFSAVLANFDAWMAALRPASFRGVPFYWDSTEGKGGRRLVTHEFPLRDDAYTEDLGRRAQRHQIRAWVIGPAYAVQRDALISACQDDDTAATLVHPTMGNLTCRAGELSWAETKERGGLCALTIEFVEDGPQASPLAATDTASMLLAGIASLQDIIAAAYETASAISSAPQYTLAPAQALFASAVTACLGLPQVAIAGLAPLAQAISANVDSDSATAAAVLAFFNATAAEVVAAQPSASGTPEDPVIGLQASIAPPADVSGGLVPLVGWGASFPKPMGTEPPQVALEAQQAAVIALVQGAALSAVLTIYAQTKWPSATAATAARGQMLELIDGQIEAAADAGADALYFAWEAISAQAMADLIRRAQSLPTLLEYAIGESTPSLTLAYRWYQDVTRGDQLELLNDAPHPLFMPIGGVRLSA